MQWEGHFVRSEAGRDRGRLFIVVKDYGNGYVGLVDGMLRKPDKPKRKKLKHVSLCFPDKKADIKELTAKKAAAQIKALSENSETECITNY